MKIVVANRKRKRSKLEAEHPGAAIIDVTSKGPEPWVRFSPFYPHGGIPIPNTIETAQSVEGLWQGLKVFENEDIDPKKWGITNMQGIKRGGKSRGAVRGHRFGPRGENSPGDASPNDTLLGYRDARRQIYLPAYRWVLENRLVGDVEQLRQIARKQTLLLLDYETNADVEDLSSPLSHAGLLKNHLEDAWPA